LLCESSIDAEKAPACLQLRLFVSQPTEVLGSSQPGQGRIAAAPVRLPADQ
jgi:hypothetical protein